MATLPTKLQHIIDQARTFEPTPSVLALALALWFTFRLARAIRHSGKL